MESPDPLDSADSSHSSDASYSADPADPADLSDSWDEEEDRRLALITPEISRRTIGLLRQLVGLEPPERVPEGAMVLADAVLAEHGPDGLRVLVMTLSSWATAQIENVAELSRRSHEAVLDSMEIACLEAQEGD
ncbi:hypothetical protein [Streptomyces sp. NPDC089799]|uniref:hypothetical protein n=1 Tax=Streptomyces sp. NPDC089799 TaxID=3155066 RepID=UPI0034168E2B